MAGSQHFRSAFNGFIREDVVHYIEYLNNQVKLLYENRAVIAAWSQICLRRLTVSIGNGIADGSLATAYECLAVSLPSWCQG